MKKLLKLLCMSVMIASIVVTSVAAEGYTADYEVFIEPQYEDVGFFNNGLAPVKQNGKWGYIDMSGNMVIAPQYDYACDFFEGKALVGNLSSSTEDWGTVEIITLGIVNADGDYKELMVPTEDGGMEQLSVDTEMYRNDAGGLIEFGYHNGFISVPNGMGVNADTYAPEIIFDRNGNYFNNEVTYTNEQGVTDTVYLAGVYSDGLFYTNSTMGVDTPNVLYFTKDKEQVASFARWPHMTDSEYVVNSVGEFYNGYAGAWGSEIESYENRFMLLNKNGEIVFAGDYEWSSYFYISADDGSRIVNDGIIALKETNGKCGAVDVTGEVAIPFVYDNIRPSKEGLCAVMKDGLWGYVDGDGKVVIEPQYTKATTFNNGIALVEKNGAPAIIDRYNNLLEGGDKIPLSCYFRPDGSTWSLDEIITVEKDGKYGFSKLTYNVGLPGVEEMSAWAYPEVIEAIENNLVPMYLRNNYFDSILRKDFAQLIVSALEEVTGKDAEALLMEKTGLTMAQAYDANPFEDTADENIIIANKLGIINGVSDVAFAPDNLIIRQDAAALLMRAAKLVSGEIETVQTTFADDESIADYAKQAVSYVTTLKIMNGVGEDRFDPTSTYTREQAYVTIVRLFNSLKK